ncbi:MAG: glycine--tRNA ligase subunit beta [Myxococcota bacterium]
MEKELIVEIGTEEVPARFIKDYAEGFKSLVLNFVKENRLCRAENSELYYTPRRVIFIKKDILERQEDEIREVYGPPIKVCYDKDGRPQKALLSFLQKFGIEEEDTYRVKSEKGELIASKIKIEGKSAIKLLSAALPQLITSIKFKKSMRWANNDISFVRPIRWVLALLGGEVIPFELCGIRSSRRSFGNYNVDSEGFEVDNSLTLLEGLEKRSVIFDVEKRKGIITSELTKIFTKYGADLIIDETLLDEVANILEFPVAIEGHFEESFLSLPSELLEVVQRCHQRYFPLKKGDRILPIFVAFANNPAGDREVIRKGMEKVLRARLNDAVFFYTEDMKKNIRDMADGLKMILYQRGLGNYDSKSHRLVKISEYIAKRLNLSDREIEEIKTAAALAKADLLSLTVGEFPELQGVMGKYFALNSGLPYHIAKAIEEHYKPILSGGDIPEGIIGRVLSIADKIDHLSGLFLINQKPSASSDPFGARRAASGIIDIIRLCKFEKISLGELVEVTLSNFDIERIKEFDSKVSINQSAKSEIIEFIRMRIKTELTEEVKADVAEALLNSEYGIDDISSVFERKDALSQFIKDEDFEKFAIVYKRASNITKDYESTEVDKSLFEYSEETELFDAINRIRDAYLSKIGERDYFNAMNILKENLYKPIFAFFDKVFVMVEDERVRNNRLSLLKNVVIMFRKIIDLSYISSMQI